MNLRMRLAPPSMLAALVVVIALAATAVVTATPPAPAHAGPPIIAGLHDTAINACDEEGTLQTPPVQGDPHWTAATASLSSPGWPSGPNWVRGGVRTVRVTIPWDLADPGIIAGGPGTVAAANVTVDQARLASTKICFDLWLHAVVARGLQPEIDFRQDNSYCQTPAGAARQCWDPSVAEDPFGTANQADTDVIMPTLAQYTDAVFRFRNEYVDCGASCGGYGPISVVAAWNEPDNHNYVDRFQKNGTLTGTHLAGTSCPANPTVDSCGAVMAAQLWSVTYELVVQGGVGGTPCPACVVVAGDFSGSGGVNAEAMIHGTACPNGGCPYIYLYNQYLKNTTSGQPFRPTVWALHPYGDIKHYQDTGTPYATTTLVRFADRLQKYGYQSSTQIWINEISTCAQPGNSTCAGNVPSLAADQSAAMRYLVGGGLTSAVPGADPQVSRIYYYCFATGPNCSADWALVLNNPNGTQSTTPAYQTFTQFGSWA